MVSCLLTKGSLFSCAFVLEVAAWVDHFLWRKTCSSVAEMHPKNGQPKKERKYSLVSLGDVYLLCTGVIVTALIQLRLSISDKGSWRC
jgi:hypothetical protein